ncbi:hypothetical protein [Limosilactobacillus allomucosae]|uniref:Uncharacterized protein n=1 Tax=Limosilactobacillus allomucosae TaxID=3142938 RepID=A0AAU7C203_9LACO
MKKEYFELLLDQLELQCSFAEYSFKKFYGMYIKFDLESSKVIYQTNDEIWFYLRGFTISLADIAKLLVLSTKQSDIRRVKREVLLQKIDILPELSVITDKKLRNALEHIDERIDEYEESGVKLVLNRNIAPNFLREMKGSVKINDQINNFNKTNYTENLFYEKNMLYYAAFGVDIPLNQAYEELLKLKEDIKKIKRQFCEGKYDSEFNG